VNGGAVTVEFFGLPASGKSTLSHRVAQILANAGMRVEQPAYFLAHGLGRCERSIRKSRHVAGEILLHPGYALRSMEAILATRQRSVSDLVKMVFNWLLVSSLVRPKRYFRGVRLLDQGVFQAFWSVGFSAKTDDLRSLIGSLRARVPTPTAVAVVEASLATIQRRLEARREFDSRVEQLGGGTNLLLVRSAALFEETKGFLRAVSSQRGEMKVFVIGNDRDEDMESNASELAKIIIGLTEDMSPGEQTLAARIPLDFEEPPTASSSDRDEGREGRAHRRRVEKRT